MLLRGDYAEERVGDDKIINYIGADGTVKVIHCFGYYSEQQIRARKIVSAVLALEIRKASPIFTALFGKRGC